jgi:hypothetical protein
VTTVPRKPERLKEAEERLEKSDFTGAREAYRHSFIKTPPSPADLSNLHVAEEWDPLCFRIKLWERHPKSRAVRAELAYAYLRVRRPRQALDILNDLIGETRASRTRIPLLLARFRAALAANAYDIASDDFAEIWRSGESDRPARLLRRSLLKDLSALGEPRAVPLLKNIETCFSNEPALLQYIAAKWRELRELDKLLGLQSEGGRGAKGA